MWLEGIDPELQAAMVLAAYRYLTSIVSVMTPERMPEMMSNLAASALHIDPHVVMMCAWLFPRGLHSSVVRRAGQASGEPDSIEWTIHHVPLVICDKRAKYVGILRQLCKERKKQWENVPPSC